MNAFVRYLMKILTFFNVPLSVHRSTQMLDSEVYAYHIHFREGMRCPALTAPVFQEFFKVEQLTADGTVVITSKVNDTRLAKLISKECQLSKAEFSISGGLMRLPL